MTATAFQDAFPEELPHAPAGASKSGLMINEKADVWSLAMVIYELLTGLVPFDANSTCAIVPELKEEIHEDRLSLAIERASSIANEHGVPLSPPPTALQGGLASATASQSVDFAKDLAKGLRPVVPDSIVSDKSLHWVVKMVG